VHFYPTGTPSSTFGACVNDIEFDLGDFVVHLFTSVYESCDRSYKMPCLSQEVVIVSNSGMRGDKEGEGKGLGLLHTFRNIALLSN